MSNYSQDTFLDLIQQQVQAEGDPLTDDDVEQEKKYEQPYNPFASQPIEEEEEEKKQSVDNPYLSTEDNQVDTEVPASTPEPNPDVYRDSYDDIDFILPATSQLLDLLEREEAVTKQVSTALDEDGVRLKRKYNDSQDLELPEEDTSQSLSQSDYVPPFVGYHEEEKETQAGSLVLIGDLPMRTEDSQDWIDVHAIDTSTLSNRIRDTDAYARQVSGKQAVCVHEPNHGFDGWAPSYELNDQVGLSTDKLELGSSNTPNLLSAAREATLFTRIQAYPYLAFFLHMNLPEFDSKDITDPGRIVRRRNAHVLRWLQRRVGLEDDLGTETHDGRIYRDWHAMRLGYSSAQPHSPHPDRVVEAHARRVQRVRIPLRVGTIVGGQTHLYSNSDSMVNCTGVPGTLRTDGRFRAVQLTRDVEPGEELVMHDPDQPLDGCDEQRNRYLCQVYHNWAEWRAEPSLHEIEHGHREHSLVPWRIYPQQGSLLVALWSRSTDDGPVNRELDSEQADLCGARDPYVMDTLVGPRYDEFRGPVPKLAPVTVGQLRSTQRGSRRAQPAVLRPGTLVELPRYYTANGDYQKLQEKYEEFRARGDPKRGNKRATMRVLYTRDAREANLVPIGSETRPVFNKATLEAPPEWRVTYRVVQAIHPNHYLVAYASFAPHNLLRALPTQRPETQIQLANVHPVGTAGSSMSTTLHRDWIDKPLLTVEGTVQKRSVRDLVQYELFLGLLREPDHRSWAPHTWAWAMPDMAGLYSLIREHEAKNQAQIESKKFAPGEKELIHRMYATCVGWDDTKSVYRLNPLEYAAKLFPWIDPSSTVRVPFNQWCSNLPMSILPHEQFPGMGCAWHTAPPRKVPYVLTEISIGTRFLETSTFEHAHAIQVNTEVLVIRAPEQEWTPLVLYRPGAPALDSWEPCQILRDQYFHKDDTDPQTMANLQEMADFQDVRDRLMTALAMHDRAGVKILCKELAEKIKEHTGMVGSKKRRKIRTEVRKTGAKGVVPRRRRCDTHRHAQEQVRLEHSMAHLRVVDTVTVRITRDLATYPYFQALLHERGLDDNEFDVDVEIPDLPFVRQVLTQQPVVFTFEDYEALIKTAGYFSLPTEAYVERLVWEAGRDRDEFEEYFVGAEDADHCRLGPQPDDRQLYNELWRVYGSRVYHRAELNARYPGISFRDLVRHGTLEAIQEVGERGRHEQQIGNLAAKIGDLPKLRWLLEQGYPRTGAMLLLDASGSGSVPCLIYLHETLKMQWQADMESPCNPAAAGGHLDALVYIHTHGGPFDRSSVLQAALGGEACLDYVLQFKRVTEPDVRHSARHDVGVMRLLHQKGGQLTARVCPEIFRHDNVPCLGYALDHGMPLPHDPIGMCVEFDACRCIEYLHRQRHIDVDDVDFCAVAAQRGLIRTLRMLHELGCAWDEDTTRDAISRDHLACLEYAHLNGCKIRGDAMVVAGIHDSIRCMRYLFGIGVKWHPQTMGRIVHNDAERCLVFAIEHGCPHGDREKELYRQAKQRQEQDMFADEESEREEEKQESEEEEESD